MEKGARHLIARFTNATLAQPQRMAALSRQPISPNARKTIFTNFYLPPKYSIPSIHANIVFSASGA